MNLLKIQNMIAEVQVKSIYQDALPFIFSAWVSPNRKEIYDKNIIILSELLDAGDTNNNFFCPYYPSSIFSLFDEDDKGLMYICGSVSSAFNVDYYGEEDHEFIVNDFFVKKNLPNLSAVREQMKNIGLLQAK